MEQCKSDITHRGSPNLVNGSISGHSTNVVPYESECDITSSLNQSNSNKRQKKDNSNTKRSKVRERKIFSGKFSDAWSYQGYLRDMRICLYKEHQILHNEKYKSRYFSCLCRNKKLK